MIPRKLNVEEYRPPEEIVKLAERRSMDIFRKWSWNPSNSIEILITSLYLQGMEDVINTIYKK